MKYTYQQNGEEVEVILEMNEGFEWVCDCGSKDNQNSWYKAIIICNSLNNVFNKENK